MTSHRSLRLAGVTSILLAVLSIVVAGQVSNHANSDRFYAMLAFEGREAEHFESLDDMAGRAEAVVRGTIREVIPSRSYGGPSDAAPVEFAAVSVEVSEVLRGNLRGGASSSITLEFMTPGGKAGIEQLAQLLPNEETLFFVRNKGTEVEGWGWPPTSVKDEEQYYRIVSTQGVLRNLGGRAVSATFDEDPVLPPSMSFEDLMSAVRKNE